MEVVKDYHIPTEVVKILNLQAAVKNLFSPTTVKDFIISRQGFIFLSKTTNQLTCAYITFIYHKH